MADDTQMTDDQTNTGDTDESSGEDMSQGYCIELKVDAQGKMSLSVEPASEESSEESGSDDEAQPVGSLREALKLITEIVAHAGQMTDTSASQDEMSAGYK